MHPITPFVTEEIWSVLPGERRTLMLESFPERQEQWADPEAEGQMTTLMGIITGIRNIRSEADIHPSTRIEACVVCTDATTKGLIDSYAAAVADMTRLSDLTVQVLGAKPADAATYIYNDIEIYVPLKGLVDVAAELQKLGREREKTEAKLRQVSGKLGNAKFLANAPADVVAGEQEKKAALEARLTAIAEAEERLQNIA
jgi:valyl-tRNA synthetase